MSVKSSTTTHSSTQSTDRYGTNHWYRIYDGPEDDAGVLPTRVIFYPCQKGSRLQHEGWDVRQKNGHFSGFYSKEEAYDFVGANMRRCPIDGRMVPQGDFKALFYYLEDRHPKELTRLKERNTGGRVTTIFVYDDCYDTQRRWMNRIIPGKSFASKEELDSALKDCNPLYPLYPEFSCHHLNCRGKGSGGCAFNHHDQKWCQYEKSPEDRCPNSKCPYNHGRGRVKHVIACNSSRKRSRSPPPAPSKPKRTETNMFSPLDNTAKDLSPNMEKVIMSPKAEQIGPNDDFDNDGFILVAKKPQQQPPQPQPQQYESTFPSLDSVVVTASPPLDWHMKIKAQKKAELDAKEETERLEKETQEETECLMNHFEEMQCVSREDDTPKTKKKKKKSKGKNMSYIFFE